MTASIITVCHKSSEKIKKYVESFLRHHSRQDRIVIEFVFVENSGDTQIRANLQPLVDNGYNVQLIGAQNNGFGAACNIGAKHANGELLIFANPDIQFLGGITAYQSELSSTSWGTVPQMTATGSKYSIDLLPEFKGFFFELFKMYYLVNKFPSLFASRSFAVGSFLVVNAKLFHQAGGFDERFFLYYEEAELARRLSEISGPLKIMAGPAIFHEGFGSHSSSSSVLPHEATGFITYCSVTNQPWLLKARLSTLRMLGLFSKMSRKRHQALVEKLALQATRTTEPSSQDY